MPRRGTNPDPPLKKKHRITIASKLMWNTPKRTFEVAAGVQWPSPKDLPGSPEMLIASALLKLGFDLADENFKGTPERFVKYLREYMHGSGCGAENLLRTGFEHTSHEYKGMVAQTNIPFRTICPHHLLPVIGKAHLGYIPTGTVVGLSKLTRVVHAVGVERPRMQEEITDILADMLYRELKAHGAIVVISAEHMCMAGRGVAAYEVPTITSSVRGAFRDVPAARDEFFRLLQVTHIK